MPIDFACPHCGQTIRVPDESAGRSGSCPRCQQPVTVPLSAGPGASAGPPVLSSVPEYAPPAKSSAAPIVAIVLASVVGVVLVIGVILALLLIPAIQAAREAARQAQCMNHLKMIGLAFHNYHSTWKCFPPAYTTDKDGKPMHSWRALILPYMEQRALYEQIRLDEPWDSPHNRALASQMPPEYRCPSDSASTGTQTSYAVIVGLEASLRDPGPVFEAGHPPRMPDILDGTSNTLLVVEVAGAGIDWMEPRDLDFAKMTYAINDGSARGIQSGHPGRACVLFCDGSVRPLSQTIDPELLKALITCEGQEVVEQFSLEP